MKNIYRLKIIGTTLALLKCGVALMLLVKTESLKDSYRAGNSYIKFTGSTGPK